MHFILLRDPVRRYNRRNPNKLGAGIVAIASSQLEAQCDSIKETETESSKGRINAEKRFLSSHTVQQNYGNYCEKSVLITRSRAVR